MSSAEAAVPDPPAIGAGLLAEIHEQPAALERLLEHEDEYARVAAAARERGATTVRMVGHGSSDNAAAYGIYAFGLLPGWTALRDSITLSVYYGAELDLRGSTVIGALAVGPHARRGRLRGAGARRRGVHGRADE